MKKTAIIFISAILLSVPSLSFAEDAVQDVKTEQKAESKTEMTSAGTSETITGPIYMVGEITYISKDKTQPAAMKRNVEINRKLVFKTREEVDAYSESIVRQLQNTRIFQDVTKEAKENPPDENGVIYVDYEVTVTDSKNFLVFPKPNYSSNSGFEMKIKLKDSNFLGFMNTLNLDLNCQLGNSSNPDDFSKVMLGTNFDYTFPFQIGITQNSWSNDFLFSWTIGETPEFRFTTGITTGIPFANNQLLINLAQTITLENDYEIFGDKLYFTEAGGISLPLTLGYINDVVPIRYTPSIKATYHWDHNGINPENWGLRGPDISIHQDISIPAVNWEGNFRNGYSVGLSHYIAYNFASESIIPYLSVDAKFFKSFKYVGINASLYAYGVVNRTPNEIGWRMRGILDNQRFANASAGGALETDAALQFSLDIPIHIITTDWLGWAAAIFGPYDSLSPGAQKFWKFPRKLFGALNFELQISPFIDIALTHNRVTGRTFSPKDGFYDAGVEVLIYPTRFRNYVVRASFGADLGRTILKDFVDTSWRNPNTKKYELFFGLGLQY